MSCHEDSNRCSQEDDLPERAREQIFDLPSGHAEMLPCRMNIRGKNGQQHEGQASPPSRVLVLRSCIACT
jgi:hypothetical protein